MTELSVTSPPKPRIHKARALDPKTLGIADLATRLQSATGADTCKGMFFNSVLAAVEKHLGAAARADVQGLLSERKYIDFFNYPSTDFLPGAFLAASLLQPAVGSFEAAMQRLGAHAIADFLATPVGATLLSVSAGNVKRIFQAAPVAYKTAVSYGVRECINVTETGCTFTVRRDLMPAEYHQGVFEEVLRSAHSQVVAVRVERTGTLDAVFHLRWA